MTSQFAIHAPHRPCVFRTIVDLFDEYYIERIDVMPQRADADGECVAVALVSFVRPRSSANIQLRVSASPPPQREIHCRWAFARADGSGATDELVFVSNRLQDSTSVPAVHHLIGAAAVDQIDAPVYVCLELANRILLWHIADACLVHVSQAATTSRSSSSEHNNHTIMFNIASRLTAALYEPAIRNPLAPASATPQSTTQ